MRGLYRRLIILSGVMIAVAATTHATAEDAARADSHRFASVPHQLQTDQHQTDQHQTDQHQTDQHQATAVRYARHIVLGEPEVISSGSYIEGTVVEGDMIGEEGGCCDSGCGSEGCSRRRNRQTEGAGDPWFNCSCNGSYKFPVPPLYTYHWPGMYSQELMTNYHSPWRFPPLRPYEDEPSPEQVEPQAGLTPGYLPVSYQSHSSRTPSSPGRGYEPFSAKIKRFYGTTR